MEAAKANKEFFFTQYRSIVQLMELFYKEIAEQDAELCYMAFVREQIKEFNPMMQKSAITTMDVARLFARIMETYYAQERTIANFVYGDHSATMEFTAAKAVAEYVDGSPNELEYILRIFNFLKQLGRLGELFVRLAIKEMFFPFKFDPYFLMELIRAFRSGYSIPEEKYERAFGMLNEYITNEGRR